MSEELNNKIEKIESLLGYYKSDKISKTAIELEFGRLFPLYHNISVQLDDTAINGSTNASYIAMLVPEYVNGMINNVLVIDSTSMKNKLAACDVAMICSAAEKFVPVAAKAIKDFINARHDTEVGYCECVELYLDLYDNFIHSFGETSTIKSLMGELTIDMNKLADIRLAIQNRTETSRSIVEYIQVNKTLPTFALNVAENLFQKINKPTVGEVDINKPVSNYWYAKLVSHVTGTFNPEKHEDLDPHTLLQK